MEQAINLQCKSTHHATQEEEARHEFVQHPQQGHGVPVDKSEVAFVSKMVIKLTEQPRVSQTHILTNRGKINQKIVKRHQMDGLKNLDSLTCTLCPYSN